MRAPSWPVGVVNVTAPGGFADVPDFIDGADVFELRRGRPGGIDDRRWLSMRYEQ
jgi:hypothetical protein